ncbi:MAG: hypothetical protein GEV10_11650 [Streptosporangiales bacterium]|nr:hypothetical protein [Streptosporangiales bacterium]
MSRPSALRQVDVLIGAALVVLGVFALFQSLQLDFYDGEVPGPGFFPSLVGIALILSGVAVALIRLRTSKGVGGEFEPPSRQQAMRSLGLWAAVFVAALAVGFLGFPLTMLLLVAVILFVIEGRRSVGAVIATIVIPLVTWMLFALLLQVPLPTGPFGS